jgi:excisionase family DNA binding protein
VTDVSVLQSIDAKLNDLLQRNVAVSGRFLTVGGAAAYSGLSDKSIRRLISRGDLVAYRPVRGRLLIDRQQLDALILGSTARVRIGRGIR